MQKNKKRKLVIILAALVLISLSPHNGVSEAYAAEEPSLVAQYDFDDNLNDSLDGSICTQYNTETSEFGINPSAGSDQTYWSWTQSTHPGGGLVIDMNRDISESYSIGVRFSYDDIDSGWNKIIDYKNQADDTGFYFFNSGRLRFYNHATEGSTQTSAGTIVDIVATRNGSTNTFTAYIITDGVLVKEVEVNDLLGQAIPSIVGGKPRFGFFFDDLATSGEHSNGGKVYSIKIWNGPITQAQAESAMNTFVTYSGNGNTGGTIPVDNTPHAKDAAVTVHGNTGNLTKTGYAFTGWNTRSDGLGADYDATGTDTLIMPASNVMLYAKWVAADNILINYSFDDDVLDSSGNGNHGTTGGSIAFVPGGRSGKAISMNANGWINLPQNLILENTSFTVSMWFKTSGTGGLFGYQNNSVGTTPDQFVPILCILPDGKLYSEMWIGSSMTVVSPDVVNDNQWHRVVMTSGTNSIRLYLDGVDIGGAAGVPAHLSMNYNQIGTNAAWSRSAFGLPNTPGMWYPYTGLIDDFTFYSTAQSPAEVAKTAQTITFNPIPAKTVADGSFDPNATSTSGLPVTYTSSDPSVASVMGSSIVIKGEGTTEITANQAGNGTYSAAAPVVRTLIVSAATSNNQGGGVRDRGVRDYSESPIRLNGQVIPNAITSSVTRDADGQTTRTLVFDDQKLQTLLNSVTADPSKQAGNVIALSAPGETGRVVSQLNGQNVRDMESKDVTLEIRTDKESYTVPAKEINIDSVSDKLGRDVKLSDIKVSISISETAEEKVRAVESAAKDGSYEIMIPPVDFNITCEFNGIRIEIDRFRSYVERTIAVPEGIKPDKITTAVIVDEGGALRHVPTQIIVLDGKYYARISSLTNSSYSVIWNPVEFADAAKHWARASINDMGSRMIVTGDQNGNFVPNRDITRAEFAAIVVRALGLTSAGQKEKQFADVKGTAWYSKDVNAAYEYGIINGDENDMFQTQNKITREQAMTMIGRAMSITGLKAKEELLSADSEKQLAAYSDADRVSKYARAGIAACIESGVVNGKGAGLIAPKENITRAEVAVIMKRLLEESNLI